MDLQSFEQITQCRALLVWIHLLDFMQFIQNTSICVGQRIFQKAGTQIQIQSLNAEEEHARNQKALADEVALKERSVTMQKSQNMDQALQMLQDFMNSPQHQGGNPSTPGSTSRNLMADATINLTQNVPSSSNVRNLDSVVRFVPHLSKPYSSDYYHTEPSPLFCAPISGGAT